jgi:hypothetical protein
MPSSPGRSFVWVSCDKARFGLVLAGQLGEDAPSQDVAIPRYLPAIERFCSEFILPSGTIEGHLPMRVYSARNKNPKAKELPQFRRE